MLSLRTRCIAAAVAVIAIVCGATAEAGAAFSAHGSVRQAYVLGAKPGARLVLADAHGRAVASGRADRFGSRVFDGVAPGAGYRVRRPHGARSRRFAILRPGRNPARSFYRGKRLKAGLNYVKMRDGIELAMTVRLPPGKTLADGPFPTLIEYSGYQTAAPHDLLGALVTSVGGGTPVDDPLAPATSTVVGAVIGPLLGSRS